MIVAESPDIYGYTIFCDDIRQEIAGKLTYVGAYHGTMIVNGQFPFLLPRFAMHFFYLQKKSVAIPPSKIVVVTPGTSEDDPFMTIEVPEEQATSAVENARQLENAPGVTSPTFVSASSPVMLTNLVIQEAGFIKVRAVRGDEFIRLGTLRVMLAPGPQVAAGGDDPAMGLPP